MDQRLIKQALGLAVRREQGKASSSLEPGSAFQGISTGWI